MITTDIVIAMKYISKNIFFFGDLSNTSYEIIVKWTDDIIEHVNNGGGLRKGLYWNIEILQKYIDVAKIPALLFYYIEVLLISGVFKFFLSHVYNFILSDY